MSQFTQGSAPRRPVVVLHIGAPRTGTSFVQDLLDDNRASFEAADLAVYTPGSLAAAGLPFIERRILDADAGGRAQAAVDLASFVQSTSKPVTLISNESLAGAPFGDTMFPLAHRFAEAAQRLAEAVDVRMVLTVRRQDTFLESYYNQIVATMNETRSFGDFAMQQGFQSLDWMEFVDVIDVLGDDTLNVLAYEDLKANPTRYLRQLLGVAEFTGDIGQMVWPPNDHNKSVDKAILSQLRTFTRFAATFEGEDFRRALISEFVAFRPVVEEHLAGQQSSGDETHKLSPLFRQALLSHYRPANEALLSRFGVSEETRRYYSGLASIDGDRLAG